MPLDASDLRSALLAVALPIALFAGCAVDEPSSSPPAGEPTIDSPTADGGSPEARLAALGIELAAPPPPVANYVRAVRTGDLVYLAGQGPRLADGSYVLGKLGKDLTIEEGYEAARLTTVALLSALRDEIGDLSRVRRIVKVNGMVNSHPSFTEQPRVINGCSDLLVEVFGERGRHARAAVGMASLPLGIAVEIDMVVEVEPEREPTVAP